MPEERGLYPRMVVEEQLLFFAELKGVPRAEAARRLAPWLERLGLARLARSASSTSSRKGMQQKAQFIATVLHEPEVLILDEPLSGLDPVGATSCATCCVDLRRQGKTLVLSSHQMETVERLCDAIALIHRGRKVLDGPRERGEAPPRQEHGGARLRGRRRLPGRPARRASVSATSAATSRCGWPTAPTRRRILREAAARLRVSRFEIVEPSLHDIFVEQVTARGEAAA